MFSNDQESIAIIIAGTIMLLLLGIFIISFLFFFQRRHNTHIVEKENLQSAFNQELLKTRIEIQEDTLANISREIHDNITQVLSFVKLNLGMIDEPAESTLQKINESRELISQSINDLRNLSKSISYEHIAMLGLAKTMESEAERINKSDLIKITISVEGEPVTLGEQRELVLFRIFQETLNNTLKHAGAKHLNIGLQYSPQMFNLTLKDDGAGFSTGLLNNNTGAGLRNMKNRAALIGAATAINSAPGEGCSIKVTLNLFEHGLNYDDTPSNRFG